MVLPVISDVEGFAITADERALFHEHRPYGFILFKRNCDNPDQLKLLTSQMREAVGNEDVPILIDQEGGRVARLGPPNWNKYPAAGTYSKLYDEDQELAIGAVKIHAMLMAYDLKKSGINVDCYPVADILYEGAHKVIGDRSYGARVDKIIALARSGAEGMMEMGVTPIIKHIPGHGRADVDSHLSLPVVDASLETLRDTDFKPFKALNDLPCAMTAHVIYSDIDPNACGTISRKINQDIIRGEIGFNGVLFSDDLSMKALNKTSAENAVDALKAGCDLALHCNGSLLERREVLERVNELTKVEMDRLNSYFVASEPIKDFDVNEKYSWLMSVTKGYE